jgi:hypothetical protein
MFSIHLTTSTSDTLGVVLTYPRVRPQVKALFVRRKRDEALTSTEMTAEALSL